MTRANALAYFCSPILEPPNQPKAFDWSSCILITVCRCVGQLSHNCEVLGLIPSSSPFISGKPVVIIVGRHLDQKRRKKLPWFCCSWHAYVSTVMGKIWFCYRSSLRYPGIARPGTSDLFFVQRQFTFLPDELADGVSGGRTLDVDGLPLDGLHDRHRANERRTWKRGPPGFKSQ